MTSHSYNVRRHELFWIMAGPLLPVVLFAVAMHAGAYWRIWPAPRPALDTERTVLLHQADACRHGPAAQILLLGDSSCLSDISARRLGEKLERSALSLATFSFLDLNAHALFLDEYRRHHAASPQAVVLLLHPEALRRLDAEPYYMRVLTNYWAGVDDPGDESFGGRASWAVGLGIFQGRIQGRLLPSPLSGAYGRRYGFSRDLEAVVTRERGSAVDPEAKPFSGVPEYRLAPTLEKASRRFHGMLPPGARLYVGITPVPAGFAGAKYPSQRIELLQTWARWLQADGILDALPAVLPDGAFVRTAHLREREVADYTDRLAAVLKPWLTGNAAPAGLQ